MPDLVIPRQLHAIGQRAIAEAMTHRASAVGAEHVLLAIAAESGAPAARVLAESGLDYPGIEAVLSTERKRSLAVADVTSVDPAVLRAERRIAKPAWAASARDLLRAADKPAAKSGRPGALEIELTIGILRANLGTVPRMLALAGIDRTRLIERLQSFPVGR
jgi:ATP-dependent Clp protease ATP-binding subunit ClpA